MKHPTLSAPEITKKLSNKWNSMDDGRKLKYKKRYLEQKEQYTRDKEQFYIEYPEARPPPHHRVRPQRKRYATCTCTNKEVYYMYMYKQRGILHVHVQKNSMQF